MSDYADITIKNHKRYGIKIVFVIFYDCDIDNSKKLSDLAKKYHHVIEENKGIYSVIDTRNIKGFSNTLAFSEAKTLKKYEMMVKSNLVSMSILINNALLSLIIDTISNIHPFVIPTKITKTNKEAMDYVIENYIKTIS